jgi:hypothetical protein
MVGGVQRPGNSSWGGGSKGLLTEEAAEAWRSGNREVVLSGEASVAGRGGRHRHDVRRSRGVA